MVLNEACPYPGKAGDIFLTVEIHIEVQLTVLLTLLGQRWRFLTALDASSLTVYF